MKIKQPKKLVIVLIAAMGFAAASQTALAHGNFNNQSGMGSGMMGGQGSGIMGGQGSGMMGGQDSGMMGGMDRGMMGGMDRGMMGGMDRGMMGGMGRGMMGGMDRGMMGGMGSGMMGGNSALDLDKETRAKINSELDSLRIKTWEINGLALKESPVLREALSQEVPDPTAVGAIYSKLFDLQQQLIESRLSTRNMINGILKDATKDKPETTQ